AGGFRVGFAPRGDGTGLEDTDLCLRMTRSTGGRWVYVPDAVVDHAVPAGRTTLRFLLARCSREGRAKIEMARLLRGRRLLDLELTEPLPALPTTDPTGRRATRAWVLVRVRTEPVGALLLDLPPDGLSETAVAAAIGERLGPLPEPGAASPFLTRRAEVLATG